MGTAESKKSPLVEFQQANGIIPNGRANTGTLSLRRRRASSGHLNDDEIKEGKEILTRVVKYLDKRTSSELGTRESLQMVMELDTPFGDLPSCQDIAKIQEYCKHLVKINFHKLFVKVWKKIHSIIDIDDEHRDDAFAFQLSVLECLKIAVAHLCNRSEELSQALGEVGAVGFLLEDLQNPRLQPDKFTAPQAENTKDIYLGILQSTLVCLHSLVTNCPENRSRVHSANGMLLLHKYARKCKNTDIKVISVLTLSYVVNEDEYELISSDEDIKSVVSTLDVALNNDEIPHIWQTGFFSFKTSDILLAINQLALYDDNKVRLVNARVLPLLLRLLDDDAGSSEEEEELTALTMWTLSFHDENRERMEHSVPALEQLLGSSNKLIRKACCGALWQLQRRKRPQPTRPVITGSGHVMISYQWECKDAVSKIKDRLKAAGYRVWMDVDKTGTTFQAVTEAVEKAEVIIICVSDKYKNSLTCRTEAEYAYDLRKATIPILVQSLYKPDGWLGAMIGVKLYFDLSDDKKVTKVFPKLVKEIGDRGKTGIYRDSFRVKSPSKAPLTSTPKTPTREHNPLPPPPDDMLPRVTNRLERSLSFTESVFSTWTRKDVKYWLRRNGLGHLTYRFRGFDGEAMHELKMIEQKAPEFFYSNLQTKFGFRNVLDITKFTRALKEIE